jgi:hypothetical protein
METSNWHEALPCLSGENESALQLALKTIEQKFT